MGNKFLIIGGSGELEAQIIRQCKSQDICSTYYSNEKAISDSSVHRLDVRDFQSVNNLVSQLSPHYIINTSVSDRSIKNLSNVSARSAIVDGAVNIARAGMEVAARTIHISTDLVFDGTRGDYDERSAVNPLSFYGRCKAEMEEHLLGLGFDLAIVRTSLIVTFKPMGHQVSWIINTIRGKNELRLFTDEYRSPILGEDLAGAIIELSQTNFCGLLNIAGTEPMNRYQLGTIIADYYGLDKDLIRPALSTETDLHRPLNCTLDSSMAHRCLKFRRRKITEPD